MTSTARQTDIFSLLTSTTPTPVQRKRRRQLRPANRDWDAEARAFFQGHTEVWSMFCEIADELIDDAAAKGRNQIAVKHVWEELRTRVVGVKLNNNFAAEAGRRYRYTYPARASWFRERRTM